MQGVLAVLASQKPNELDLPTGCSAGRASREGREGGGGGLRALLFHACGRTVKLVFAHPSCVVFVYVSGAVEEVAGGCVCGGAGGEDGSPSLEFVFVLSCTRADSLV